MAIFRHIRFRSVPLFLAGLSIAFVFACSSHRRENSGKSSAPPGIPAHFVLRPEFSTKDGLLSAGTAFPIEMAGSDRILILTATHLFGPAGGLPQQIGTWQLPSYVSGITLFDAYTKSQVASAGPMIEIRGAEAVAEGDNGDVAAFWAPSDAGVGRARLCTTPPGTGEVVWLAAALIDGPEAELPLHRAIIKPSRNKWLEYEFDNPRLNLTATSGAPVLNSEGDVIGINVGGVRRRDKLIGSATHVNTIRTLLDRALKSASSPGPQ